MKKEKKRNNQSFPVLKYMNDNDNYNRERESRIDHLELWILCGPNEKEKFANSYSILLLPNLIIHHNN